MLFRSLPGRGPGLGAARPQARAILEELEPRVLYSADSPVALFGAAPGVVMPDARVPSAATPTAKEPAPGAAGVERASAKAQEIVFVDTQVAGYQALVDDIASRNDGTRQLEVVLLDPKLDGVSQITQALRQRGDIAAVHIISHGADGAVQLGAGTLDFETLLARASDIRSWGDALTADADLLLYGCDVAADADGRALVNALSRLTGADVAASTDVTGQRALGGNWNLEYDTGQIEARIAVSQASQQEWAGRLAITSNSASSGMTAVAGATSLTWSHTVSAGSNVALFVGISIEAGSGASTGVTYGGTAMTLVGRSTGSHVVEIWKLVAPTAGTANIVATFNGTVQVVGGGAAFNGVDQTTPTGVFAGAGGTSTTPTVNASSAAGDLVLDTLYGNDGPTATPGAGQTSQWTLATGSGGGKARGAGSTEAGAASVTMSYTLSSSLEWQIGAVSIKAAAASSAPILTGLAGDSQAYTSGSGAVVIEQGGNVGITDSDSPDFNTGTLTVSFAAGSDPTEDVLAVRNQGTGAGQIGVSGANVTYGGVTIGTFTGGSAGSNLVITLNASSNTTDTAALIQNITFQNTNTTTPTGGARTVRFVLTDGDGGASANYDATVTLPTYGTLIWRTNGDTSPNYSDWTGSSFTTAGNTATVGSWRLLQGAQSTTRDEKMVVGVNASGQISGEMWNGTSWSALSFNNLATVSSSTNLGFGVAYESQSGNAMLVWNNGTTGTTPLSYRTWNGSAWSAAQTITVPGSVAGEAYQMRLTASPVGNGMILTVSPSNAAIDYALVWNGSSWGNSIALDTAFGVDRTEVNVAYESQSGRALVVYDADGSTNALAYRTWDGSAWSAQFSVSAPTGTGAGSDITWTSMASDPKSNRIILGGVADGNETWFKMWDGSSWDAGVTATTNNASITSLNVAVAFEAQSGQALAVYAVSGSSVVRYRTWDVGGGWSAEQSGPNIGGVANTMLLSASYSSDKVMLSVQDANNDLHAVLWDGAAWGAKTTLETNTGETGNQPFGFLWNDANHAPVLDASKSPALGAINEDAGAPSGAVGTPVSALVDFASPSGQVDNVTDADGGAALGIAITAADTANGTWWYSTNGGTAWNALGAVTNASARLLAADANTRVYFQPNADYNGTLASAITFRAWDQSSGANGAVADASVNGGATAFSTATDTASLNVNAVNDAPTATNLSAAET